MEAINKVCANVAQDFSEEEKAQGRANIGAVSSSDVSSAITTAVNSLDYQDTAVSHQFVTEVDETDGVISVTRAQPSTSDIAGLPDALAAKQDALTTGPNVDIYNNIISTEKSKVSAGANVSVSSSLDNVNRVVTYTVSATDTTYTAGSNITIDSNNVISASASPQINTDWEASSGVAELLNKPNLAYKYASDTATAQLKGIQYGQNSNGDWHHQIIINNGAMQSVGWGVPTRPSASANLVLTTDANGKMQWTPFVQTGSDTQPVYINANREFAACSVLNYFGASVNWILKDSVTLDGTANEQDWALGPQIGWPYGFRPYEFHYSAVLTVPTDMIVRFYTHDFLYAAGTFTPQPERLAWLGFIKAGTGSMAFNIRTLGINNNTYLYDGRVTFQPLTAETGTISIAAQVGSYNAMPYGHSLGSLPTDSPSSPWAPPNT